MRGLRSISDQLIINELFNNIARQKEIMITFKAMDKHFNAVMTSNYKTGDTLLINCSENMPVLGSDEKIEISFFYKETFFFFEAEIVEVFQKSFSVSRPQNLSASFERSRTRYKISKDEDVLLGFWGDPKKYKVVDISTSGLSFEHDTVLFGEGQVIRNLLLIINTSTTICLDASVKYVRNVKGVIRYGLSFISLEWTDFQALSSYIFERCYPNIKSLANFTQDEISKFYDKSRFSSLTATASRKNMFMEQIKSLEKIKNNPMISTNLVYQKNGKLIAVASALRIINRTFLAYPLLMVPEAHLNSKAKADIFIGLAESLSSHPYFENFVTYINSDLEWYQGIFENIDRVIGDQNKHRVDYQELLEYKVDAIESYESNHNYRTQALSNPAEFIDYCSKNLSPLEISSFGYRKEGIALNAIKEVYQVIGFSVKRCIFSIKEGEQPVAYAVAETYAGEFGSSGVLDTIKLYRMEAKDDIDAILSSLLSEAAIFFKVNNVKKFSVLLDIDKNMPANISSEAFVRNQRVMRVLMNQEGLSEFNRLLSANFEYYSKYYRLSQPQKSIWLTEKAHPGTSIGIVAGTLKMRRKIDPILLEKAINIFVEKNDAMRLRIMEDNGEPKQYIKKYEYFKVDFVDFSQSDRSKSLYQWDDYNTQKPFDLIDSDLFYFAIIKISEDYYGIYTKMHHLISDAWTMSLFGSQVIENYNNLQNQVSLLKVKKPSYIDFLLEEEDYKYSERFLKSREFWNNKLEGITEFTSIKSLNHGSNLTQAERKSLLLNDEINSGISRYCEEYKISNFSFFMAIYSVFISRKSIAEDIVIGTPILNRSGIKEKDTAGMFISAIPIRLFVNGNMSFLSYVQYVAKELNQCFKHQKYNYELILKDFREKYKVTDKLYDCVISYQNSKYEKGDAQDAYEARWHFNKNQVETLVFHIDDREDCGELLLNMDYLTSAFTPGEINDVFESLINMIKDVINNPGVSINKLDMLTASEKRDISKTIMEFNDTQTEFAKESTIHQLIEEQVDRTPDNVALIYQDHQLTYQELNAEANRLAAFLRKNGVKPGDIIGILVQRSIEMIVSIIAVLKAGGAYLPIDPAYPKDRIDYVLANSEAKILLSQRNLVEKAVFSGSTIILDDTEIWAEGDQNITNVNTPEDLAYVIYTSGSTGNPKGVMIEHHSVVNFMQGVCDRINFSEGKSILALTTFSFDIFFLETILPLTKGLRVVLASDEEQNIPKRICDLIIKHEVKMLQSTPSRFNLILEDAACHACFRQLTDIMAGGEAFTESLLSKLKKITSANIYNMYGPTETTIWSTISDLTKKEKIDIGRPIANTKIYILDKYLNPLPIGCTGDLYIGGEGVARGYLNNAEQTSQKFIANPFIKGTIIYKTGDLARWNHEDNIECLGRVDHQVKINGYRVELEEIEKKMLSHELVKDAAVVDREDQNGRKFLCAYYVSDKSDFSTELRAYLSGSLPNYMIPSCFQAIEKIPLTPNGKINRKALPEIIGNQVQVNYCAPRDIIECTLAEAWAQALEIEKVGIDHNLFEMGADSLTIIRIQTLLHTSGYGLNSQDFYAYQTIRELAKKIRERNYKDEVAVIQEIGEENADPSKYAAELLTHVEFSNVFVTGATGVLGVHILRDLIETTNSNIYCLVRGKDYGAAKERFLKTLNFYFGNRYDAMMDHRVFIVNGDVSLEKFGLIDAQYEALGAKIDCVIHTAAIVRHYGNYDDYNKINVNGTREVITFCMKYNAKLSHISSVSVSGNYLLKNKKGASIKTFDETDLDIGQSYLENVYVRSKFESECLVLEAIKNDLDASIFRVGILSGRYEDGHFQMNIDENGFYNRIRSIIKLGMIPSDLLEQEIEFTPVDLCSQALIKINNTKESRGLVFHLFNHNYFRIEEMIAVFNRSNKNIDIVSREQFKKYIGDIIQGADQSKVLSGIINDFNDESLLDYKPTVDIKSDITRSYLVKLGFEWPKLTAQYIENLLVYMKKVLFVD